MKSTQHELDEETKALVEELESFDNPVKNEPEEERPKKTKEEREKKKEQLEKLTSIDVYNKVFSDNPLNEASKVNVGEWFVSNYRKIPTPIFRELYAVEISLSALCVWMYVFDMTLGYRSRKKINSNNPVAHKERDKSKKYEKKFTWWPRQSNRLSIKQIAQSTHCKIRTARRAKKELAEKCMIYFVEKNGHEEIACNLNIDTWKVRYKSERKRQPIKQKNCLQLSEFQNRSGDKLVPFSGVRGQISPARGQISPARGQISPAKRT